MRASYIIISAILSTVMMSHAFSATIELFDKKGHPIGIIDKNRIHDGDILKFSDKSKFEIISFLGEGSMSVVYKARMVPRARGVPEVLALRIPKNTERQDPRKPPQEYLNSYLDGYPALEEQEIPIPKKFKSAYGEYIASELIKSDFNGHDFFVNPDAVSKKFSPEVLQQAEEALVHFARFTVRFKSIGDFSPSQLVYNIHTKSWTLLDWFNMHEVIESRKMKDEKSHAFKEGFETDLALVEGKEGVPETHRPLSPREKRIIERLGTAILAERKNFSYVRCFLGQFFNR